jgi:DNA-binding NtrC family response regulator
VDLFLGRTGERQSQCFVGVSAAAMRRLIDYPWPGNVRELANLLERAAALSEHDTLLPEDLDFPSDGDGMRAFMTESATSGIPLDEVERNYVRHVLEAHRGNKTAAARILGINRRTLYRKLGGQREAKTRAAPTTCGTLR